MLYQFAWNELKSSVPGVDDLYAQKLVDRAWKDIQASRRWSFLCAEFVLTAPDVIGSGTISATKGSPIIVLDAAAQLSIAGLTTNELVQRTIRIGTGLYNIIAYAAPNLTVEYGYNGPSVAGSVYMLYQPYYLAPFDFLSWVSVIDPYSPIPTFNTTTTKVELDSRDPQRAAMGQPHVLATYRYERNLAGSNPPILDRHRFEMWPHPIIFRQYLSLYQKKNIPFTTGLAQPSVIPDSLIMSKVRFYAYEWAMANKGKHPELKGTDWMALRVAVGREFEEELANTSRQDEEIFIQNYPRSYMSTAGWMLGEQYYFNHGPIWGGGGW